MYKGRLAEIVSVSYPSQSYSVQRLDPKTLERIENEVDTPFEPNRRLEPLPEFVPTSDWQEVLPGQEVPGGCRTRMDVKSGKTFAKWIPGRGPGYFKDGIPTGPVLALLSLTVLPWIAYSVYQFYYA